jgi:hypothetical protein
MSLIADGHQQQTWFNSGSLQHAAATAAAAAAAAKQHLPAAAGD